MALVPDALSAQERPDPREYVGCYALFLGPWEPALPIGADMVYLRPPTSIELTDRKTRGGAGWEIRPLTRPNPRFRFAEWSRVGNGIRLVWSSGFSGLRAALTRQGESFVGYAESFWDFERPTQRATIEALPVQCRS